MRWGAHRHVVVLLRVAQSTDRSRGGSLSTKNMPAHHPPGMPMPMHSGRSHRWPASRLSPPPLKNASRRAFCGSTTRTRSIDLGPSSRHIPHPSTHTDPRSTNPHPSMTTRLQPAARSTWRRRPEPLAHYYRFYPYVRRKGAPAARPRPNSEAMCCM